MFLCECGGILLVVGLEEPPEYLTTEEKLIYKRVCDVKCQKCGKVKYSQPYDDGRMLNEVKKTKPL